MKKLILSMALAFAFSMPVASPSLAGDPYYTVRETSFMYQHSFGRGQSRCMVYPGTHLTRHWGENWSRWIYVKVVRHGTMFNFACRGWIDKRRLDPR